MVAIITDQSEHIGRRKRLSTAAAGILHRSMDKVIEERERSFWRGRNT
jgi:hypothetical protein